MKNDKNEKAEETKKAELFDVSELKEKKGTDDATFEGVKAFKGWSSGKAVSEAEYDKAVKEFETTAIDGR